ncbi:hypothetical protein AAG570_007966 [Ranatra chinensis]|uniref:Uncharacterized protein n=1 Tax=Ranatra chinensis TaxID=642074 RepID=A0ABD0YH94_9HEMI
MASKCRNMFYQNKKQETTEIASKHKCDPHSFTCSNKNCIDHKMVCNGMDDCEDNSDEKNCLTTSVSVPEITETFPEQSIVCTEMQIFCPDQSICLPIAAKCNGTSECLNGEDEINCMTCQDDEFECSTEHICIPKKWVCDKSYDCIDKSDEDPAHCSHLTGRTNSHMDEKCTGYHCKDNYKCIPFSKICDKNLDCEDGSDEGGLCGNYP